MANFDSAIGAIAPDRTEHRAADLSQGHAPKTFQQFSHRHLHAGDINADRLAPGADIDEGISVESSDASYVIPYQGVHAVTIKRRFFSEDIAQILLKGKGGEAALPSLETPEPFLVALQQRVGSVPFIEKRSFLA